MSEQDLLQRIEKLELALKRLQDNPPLPDHFHTGVDISRIQFKDLDRIYYKSATVNPGSLLDGAGETVQITGVTGAALGDFVLVSAPYDLQDITVTGYVQAAGVVEIRIQNEGGATVDLASGTWRIMVIKKII